jgi:membrane-associated protease RseP (regulator of RpoE activity)
MLDEMSPYEAVPPVDFVATSQEDASPRTIHEAVAEVFRIESEEYDPGPGLTAVFTGELLLDSEEAYEKLDSRLASLDQIPLFREKNGVQVIQIVEGRPTVRPRPWWPNAVLFVFTVLSLLYTGAGIALGEALLENPDRQLTELWRGWPYALSIVLILGAHEMGHYFSARRHHIPVTLPYFIPLPFGFFGTLGAFIQMRAPIRNRKMLLDVGATGPLVGLIVAVPILLIGLATAEIRNLPTDSVFLLEGNSILYAAAKIATFGRFLPAGRMDVFLNQLAQAGWTGLFVTALNLIPVGQLDGGHVLYTLLGDRAKALYFPAVLAMSVLAIAVSDAWFLWVLLLLVFGRAYATPLDMLTPLDKRRRFVAILALVVFVLVFVPNPLQVVEPVSSGPVQMF